MHTTSRNFATVCRKYVQQLQLFPATVTISLARRCGSLGISIVINVDCVSSVRTMQDRMPPHEFVCGFCRLTVLIDLLLIRHLCTCQYLLIRMLPSVYQKLYIYCLCTFLIGYVVVFLPCYSKSSLSVKENIEQ